MWLLEQLILYAVIASILYTIKLLISLFPYIYTDQKPLDLAQGAEMKHILTGNKVCSNGLLAYDPFQKNFELLKYIDGIFYENIFLIGCLQSVETI